MYAHMLKKDKYAYKYNFISHIIYFAIMNNIQILIKRKEITKLYVI